MERIAVDVVEPAAVGGAVERRGLSEPLGTADVAINRYRLPPGERLAGLHAHADQEEVFVVLEGAVTFETLDGRVVAAAGEAVRFAPGEFQSCTNGADRAAVVLALGAPRHSGALRIPVPCPSCGNDGMGLEFDDRELLVCPDCGETVAPGCPNCGGDDLRAVLADDGETPVSVCRDCGAEFEEL